MQGLLRCVPRNLYEEGSGVCRVTSCPSIAVCIYTEEMYTRNITFGIYTSEWSVKSLIVRRRLIWNAPQCTWTTSASSARHPRADRSSSASSLTLLGEKRDTTPYTLSPAPYTPHPTLHTLHPTPYTPHPTLYTSHPAPHTLHLTPYTSHPTPRTPHLAPHTLNLTHYTGKITPLISPHTAPRCPCRIKETPDRLTGIPHS